jgi:hypothetical protein
MTTARAVGVVACVLAGIHPSDHFPLLAVVQLPAPKQQLQQRASGTAGGAGSAGKAIRSKL